MDRGMVEVSDEYFKVESRWGDEQHISHSPSGTSGSMWSSRMNEDA